MEKSLKFKDYKYKRVDIKKVGEECKKHFNTMNNASCEEDFLKAMNDYLKLSNHVNTMFTLVEIRQSINTKDEFYDKEKNYVDEINPIFKKFTNEFYKAILNPKFKNTVIKEFGEHILNIAKVSLKTFSDEVIDDLVNENKLVSKYNKLIASAKIKFKDEEMNISRLTSYLQDNDSTLRKEAFYAYDNFMYSIKDTLDMIYDELVKVRTKISKKLGYENFLQLAYDRMKRTDYNPQMVSVLREEIKNKIVPLSVELLRKQKERLNIDKLKYYDESLMYIDGNARVVGDDKFILNEGIKMYSELSDTTKEYFNFLMDKELLDVLTKENKNSGGYCTIIADYKSPFIFSNFNGTQGDIEVLTHEAGHGFQMYLSRDYSLQEFRFPTLESCEIHSTSMEYFTYPWMKNFFGDDVNKYYYSHLVSNIHYLAYEAAVDEFQTLVYTNPNYSIAERNKVWKSLEKKYLPLRDYDGGKYFSSGRFWQKQLHIFVHPMYYIDYSLAQIIALDFYRMDLLDHNKTFQKYISLCKKGGSLAFLDLCKSAGLINPFQENALDKILLVIKERISELEKLI